MHLLWMMLYKQGQGTLNNQMLRRCCCSSPPIEISGFVPARDQQLFIRDEHLFEWVNT